jgi:hypothetical protein
MDCLACVSGLVKNGRGKEDEGSPLHHFELRIWRKYVSEVRGDEGKKSDTMSCELVAML